VLAELPGERAHEAPLTGAARAALDVVHGDTVRCVPLHRGASDARHQATDDPYLGSVSIQSPTQSTQPGDRR
jgi:arginine N-succinyltransferase